MTRNGEIFAQPVAQTPSAEHFQPVAPCPTGSVKPDRIKMEAQRKNHSFVNGNTLALYFKWIDSKKAHLPFIQWIKNIRKIF